MLCCCVGEVGFRKGHIAEGVLSGKGSVPTLPLGL